VAGMHCRGRSVLLSPSFEKQPSKELCFARGMPVEQKMSLRQEHAVCSEVAYNFAPHLVSQVALHLRHLKL